MPSKRAAFFCAVATSLFLLCLLNYSSLNLEDELKEDSSVINDKSRAKGFIARNLNFTYGNQSSTNLYCFGSVDLIRRDYPKIGPFRLNMSRTLVMEGVKINIHKHPGPPEDLLKDYLQHLIPDLKGAKLHIKNLTLTSDNGTQRYASYEP